MHQGHIAEPASKGVYTLLSLGKVLRVCPGGHVGALEERKKNKTKLICDKTSAPFVSDNLERFNAMKCVTDASPVD